ncbi:hypothetical protein PENSUB_4028 [Penicillium subrubescens]|uniref:Uncharacterized protein n=1 Tax=Penicillium subrubescens TaxID=1316194 RepID=A0A1Q5UE23_9EURO|nr:hypothetical protein PENSUB_4028 [Penicillium subrubescens]
MDIWKEGLAIVQELILSPQGLGIRVLGTTDWGNPSDCDYKIYEQVVEATHRFKSIFYDAE